MYLKSSMPWKSATPVLTLSVLQSQRPGQARRGRGKSKKTPPTQNHLNGRPSHDRQSLTDVDLACSPVALQENTYDATLARGTMARWRWKHARVLSAIRELHVDRHYADSPSRLRCYVGRNIENFGVSRIPALEFVWFGSALEAEVAAFSK
ncbi:hypothetical protein F5Y18DRAFT_413338 [Xylariaceae sp. FL1019]|nr:hypothetical protein F5Y18DRAFT_413338 [Xylariaceae sp. FL1019]